MAKETPKLTSKEISSVLCFISGMAVALMGYSVYSHLKYLHDRNNIPKKTINRNGAKIEDSIRLKSLAYLTQSQDVNIQSSSIKIILERAMSAANLAKLIASCEKDQPIEIKSKALPSLQLLTRKENNKATLLEAGALRVLVDALKCDDPDMTEVTKRYVAVAICDLIQGSDINKYCILDMGILDPIKDILTSTEIKNNELKYWTLMILYQISLSDPLPKVLIENGFVSLLATMARMTYGNTNMPKFCMQSLVRIAANVDVAEAKKILKELLDYNIVELISNCLRGDDVELIYWAAGLMHEYVLKDVAADKFREIKGIHTILAGLLSAEEMYISRVILRTIKFMATGQESFRQEMVRSGIVKKIMHCLSLDDEDVRYWAILCIHVVAGQVESHEDIISSTEFEVLLELAVSAKMKVSIFVSDILSLLCCISNNNTFMEPHISQIIKTLNTLLMEGELDVQYNAAGAIFNVMTMTYAFASKVRDSSFDALTLVSASASHERVQLSCAKGALMVAIKNQFLIPQLNHQVTEPLIDTVNGISNTALPVMIMQSLVQAARGTSTPKYSPKDAKTVQLHDNDQYTIDEDEKKSTDYDDDDNQYPQEIIDINEQGMISNASRLDRVLKGREKSNKKPNKKMGSSNARTDISYLFDTSIPSSQREKLFAQFELPSSSRDQLVGALSVLNVLLENDQIIGNVVTGETFSFPPLNAEDELILSMQSFSDADKHSAIMEQRANVKPFKTFFKTVESNELSLPENIQQFIQNLVRISLFPVLPDWADSHSQEYVPENMTEPKAQDLYSHVIQNICSCVKLSELGSDKFYNLQSSDEDDNSSSDEQGPVSIHTQLRPSLRSGHFRCNTFRQSGRRHEYDSSSDDSEGNPRAHPVFRKRIESAAERLGETRRNGERFDLDDMGITSYASRYYIGFSNRALILLNSLVRYASVRQYLIQETHFISILTYLYENHGSLADQVMICLGSLFTNNPDVIIPESTFQLLVILLWRNARLPNLRKSSNLFYSQLVLSYCSGFISSNIKNGNLLKKAVPSMTNNPLFVELDLLTRSKYCFINHGNYLQVRNDSWTFESVRATHCVPALVDNDKNATHKYAFEVVLDTDGLMQIGWVTEHFQFDSEGGKGVGDDGHSYGYDGNRCKKWHGRFTNQRSSYGMKWAEGDVVTCAIDMDAGEIHFLKNGVDMGVAFYGVLTSRAWYPAVSLSTGQQCKFQFGGAVDPLKYLPKGYQTIATLALEVPSSVELPPPHFTKTLETDEVLSAEETDISDLTRALGNMSVQSPVSPQGVHVKQDGSAEPNLKPVDGSSSIADSISAHQKTVRKIDSVENLGKLCNEDKEQDAYPIQTEHKFKKPLPSLYYEVTVEFFNKSGDPLTYEESLISFGLQGLTPGLYIYFEYNRVEHKCNLVFKNRRSESFDLAIKDGDTVGVIYIDETNEFGVTLNGKLEAYVYLDECSSVKPYLPVTTGIMRSEINYGSDPFHWKIANSTPSSYHIINYFDRLIQKQNRSL